MGQSESTEHVEVVSEFFVLHQVFLDLGGVDPSHEVLQVTADKKGWIFHHVWPHPNVTLRHINKLTSRVQYLLFWGQFHVIAI